MGGLRGLELGAGGIHVGLCRSIGAFGLVAPRLELACTRLVGGKACAHFREIVLCRALLFVQHENRRVEAVGDTLRLAVAHRSGRGVLGLVLQLLLQLFGKPFCGADLKAQVLYLRAKRPFALDHLVPSPLQVAQIVDRQSKAQLGQLGGKVFVLQCALGLALEGLDLALHFRDDVGHAREMDVHLLELPLAFLLALLVLQNSCSLFDERAALLGLGLQDLAEMALRYDRVGARSHTGVVKDVEHVHAAGDRAVDQVFAHAAAVHAPRDGHLAEFHGQRAVGVVEHKLHLGDADGLPRGRAGENHVFHGLPAQVLRVTLA